MEYQLTDFDKELIELLKENLTWEQLAKKLKMTKSSVKKEYGRLFQVTKTKSDCQLLELLN